MRGLLFCKGHPERPHVRRRRIDRGQTPANLRALVITLPNVRSRERSAQTSVFWPRDAVARSHAAVLQAAEMLRIPPPAIHPARRRKSGAPSKARKAKGAADSDPAQSARTPRGSCRAGRSHRRTWRRTWRWRLLPRPPTRRAAITFPFGWTHSSLEIPRVIPHKSGLDRQHLDPHQADCGCHTALLNRA